MNSTHIHLMLTHFPIIGSILATVLLMFAIWKRNSLLQEISLTAIVLMAILTIPVFITGEPAEETVEHIAGISEATVEAHEEAAEGAFWVMIVSGVVSLGALALGRLKHKAVSIVARASLALCLVTTVLMARTGYLGGQIRHTEISGEVALNENATDHSAHGSEEEQEAEDDD